MTIGEPDRNKSQLAAGSLVVFRRRWIGIYRADWTGVSCMTAYQFSCVAPFASLFFIIGIAIFILEWKGWF